MRSQQPALGLRMMPFHQIIDGCDSKGLLAFLMIEALDSIQNIDSIASVDDVNVLLVGCLDLSTDMGIPGDFNATSCRTALEAVSEACARHGRIMGLAGLYNNPKLQDWAINTLNVRFIISQQYSNLLAADAIQCVARVNSVDRTSLLPKTVTYEGSNGWGVFS